MRCHFKSGTKNLSENGRSGKTLLLQLDLSETLMGLCNYKKIYLKGKKGNCKSKTWKRNYSEWLTD